MSYVPKPASGPEAMAGISVRQQVIDACVVKDGELTCPACGAGAQLVHDVVCDADPVPVQSLDADPFQDCKPEYSSSGNFRVMCADGCGWQHRIGEVPRELDVLKRLVEWMRAHTVPSDGAAVLLVEAERVLEINGIPVSGDSNDALL